MRDPPPHLDLKIGQSSLAFVSTAKGLGVWLQNDLKWDTPVHRISKNANKRLFMLRSLNVLGLVNLNNRVYIRNLLEYSDIIWHSSLTSNQANQLERFQKRALRIVLGPNYVSYVNALGVCDIERLSARREQHSLRFVHFVPQCNRTSKLLTPYRGEIKGRQVRNNAKIYQPVLTLIDILVVQFHIMWS